MLQKPLFPVISILCQPTEAFIQKQESKSGTQSAATKPLPALKDDTVSLHIVKGITLLQDKFYCHFTVIYCLFVVSSTHVWTEQQVDNQGKKVV